MTCDRCRGGNAAKVALRRFGGIWKRLALCAGCIAAARCDGRYEIMTVVAGGELRVPTIEEWRVSQRKAAAQ
jgi:hypothetical protein